MKICKIEGCDSVVNARQMCGGHYSAWHRDEGKGIIAEERRVKSFDPDDNFWDVVAACFRERFEIKET